MRIPSYLLLSIFVTLCLFPPLGIVAIVFAIQVKRKQAAGDIEGAKTSSLRAKKFALLGLGIGVMTTVASFGYQFYEKKAAQALEVTALNRLIDASKIFTSEYRQQNSFEDAHLIAADELYNSPGKDRKGYELSILPSGVMRAIIPVSEGKIAHELYLVPDISEADGAVKWECEAFGYRHDDDVPDGCKRSNNRYFIGEDGIEMSGKQFIYGHGERE